MNAPSLNKRLLSGGAWAVGGKIGAVVIGLACNMLLARLLTPGEFGSYLLILSVVSVGALVGCLGLNKATVRLVAETMGLGRPDRTRRVILIVFGLGLLGASGTGLLYHQALGGMLAGVFGVPALATVAGLIAGAIAVSTAQELFAETFRGFHDVRLATLFGSLAVGNSAGLVMRALFLGCLLALWFASGQTNLWTVVLIMVGASSVSALISSFILFTRTNALSRSATGDGATDGADDPAREAGVGGMLGVSLPLLVNGLTAFVLVQADLWIIAAFLPAQEVAVYGAASRFMTLVTMPLMIVNAVMPPVIAELYARGEKEQLERILRPVATLTALPAVLALAALALAGGPILGLLYGDFYSAGAAVLTVLCFGKLAAVLAGSCGLTLQMTGYQKEMMWISVGSGLLFVAGALLVVRDFGTIGVAGVAAFSIAFQNLLALFVARTKTGIWTHAAFSTAPVGKLLTIMGLRR